MLSSCQPALPPRCRKVTRHPSKPVPQGAGLAFVSVSAVKPHKYFTLPCLYLACWPLHIFFLTPQCLLSGASLLPKARTAVDGTLSVFPFVIGFQRVGEPAPPRHRAALCMAAEMRMSSVQQHLGPLSGPSASPLLHPLYCQCTLYFQCLSIHRGKRSTLLDWSLHLELIFPPVLTCARPVSKPFHV